MTTVRITKRTVDAAKPGMRAGVPCDSFLFDTEIKGFGLRVKAGSGTKTYILQYRDGRGRESAKMRVTIGDLPRTSGPARMLVQGWSIGQWERGRRSWPGLRSRPRDEGGHEDFWRRCAIAE